MNDWIGLIFFVLVIVGIFVGLRILSKPTKRTAEDFEKRAAEGSGLSGSGMQALHELLNPEAAKGKETVTQLKEGRFGKKKREGKGDGSDLDEENDDGKTD
jgi:hypothetical protein